MASEIKKRLFVDLISTQLRWQGLYFKRLSIPHKSKYSDCDGHDDSPDSKPDNGSLARGYIVLSSLTATERYCYRCSGWKSWMYIHCCIERKRLNRSCLVSMSERHSWRGKRCELHWYSYSRSLRYNFYSWWQKCQKTWEVDVGVLTSTVSLRTQNA